MWFYLLTAYRRKPIAVPVKFALVAPLPACRQTFRSEYKAVVYWSRFTALLRKKNNPYRRRDRRRRSLSGCIIPTYNNSCPETSACFIIIIPELLLKLKNTVPTPVNQDRTNNFYESKRARAIKGAAQRILCYFSGHEEET